MLARWLFHSALLLALAAPARAEPPHLPLDRARLTEGAAHLRYEARWGGLHAGDFILALNNGGGAYAGRFDMQTRGVIDWLIRLKILARSQGPVNAVHSLSALDYRVDYVTRSRDSWMAVRFDPGGGPAQARQTQLEQ